MLKKYLLPIVNRLALSHKSCGDLSDANVIDLNDPVLIVSSFTVLMSYVQGEKVFIRLVRTHTAIEEYVHQTIDLFFDLAEKDEAFADCRKKAHEDLRNKDNFKRVLNTEQICRKHIMDIESAVFGEIELFGFPSLKGRMSSGSLCKFIVFLRGELSNYQYNDCVKRGCLQTFASNLQLATKTLADCLGIGELIPDISFSNVRIKDHVYAATIMASAPGEPANELEKEKRRRITPRFVKSISNLDYFDAICYQKDHKQRNYNVVSDEDGGLIGVSSFDNDAPSTFFPMPGFPKTVSLMQDYRPVCDRRGRINRDFIDKDFAQSLCRIQWKELHERLQQYLTLAQIAAVWYRIRKLRKGLGSKDHEIIDFTSENEGNSLLAAILGQKESKTDYLRYFMFEKEADLYRYIKI